MVLVRYSFIWLVSVLMLSQIIYGCKKNSFLSKGNLEFSVDTLVFDTVFTTIGSTTHQFKIYNRENRTIVIDEIELMGGNDSPFRINIDGLNGISLSNMELEAKDSLFVFVEVTLDINNQNLPMILEDSIRFRTNGKDQYVKLAVWGQDAYFHYKEEILNSETWFNDKPHVIYGYAAIDSAQTLTIQAGTKIYLHKNSILYVYKGALNINGTKDAKVTLQGDRLESYYDDVAGQYYGIYFHKALPSSINHCDIKNGISGIHLYSEDSGNSGYTLKISNSTISNCASYGLFVFQGAKIKAENCILAKNGVHSLLVLGGGDFNINHCHLLGYGSGENSSPAVGISNSYFNSTLAQTEISAIDEGVITNSVIYGNQDFELVFDTINPNQTFTFGFQIRNNLIKSETQFSGNYFSNNDYNINPMFKNIEDGDFYYYSNSPLNNTSDPTFPTSNGMDIQEIIRNPISDKGAYELL